MALRVTRQQIEVLREPFDPFAVLGESDISLTDDASATVEFGREASSAIALTSLASVTTVLALSASSSLSLTQDATPSLGDVVDVDAESSLSLTDSASVLVAFAPVATSTLSLTQDADVVRAISVDAESTLVVSQDTSVQTVINLDVVSLLQETRLEFVPGTLDLVPVIYGLNDSASVQTNLTLHGSSGVLLGQNAKVAHLKDDAIEVDADNSLSLTQSGVLSTVVTASSTLALTQSATGVAGKLVESELALTQTASVTITRGSDADSDLSFTQYASVVLVPAGGIRLCEYSNSIEPLQGPYPGVTSRFSLIFPADGAATDTVELRPPNLGNRDRLVFNRINRESRGGTLIVYADPIWPKVQTLLLTLSTLTREQADEVIRFKEEHIGQEIILSDWEQRQWRGVITTPDEPIIEDSRGRFTTSFTFEGELISV